MLRETGLTNASIDRSYPVYMNQVGTIYPDFQMRAASL